MLANLVEMNNFLYIHHQFSVLNVLLIVCVTMIEFFQNLVIGYLINNLYLLFNVQSKNTV